jgi:hypothetical protein
MAVFVAPKWVEKSWEEYKAFIASVSPRLLGGVLYHRKFNKIMTGSFVVSVLYLSMLVYFLL